MCQPWIDVTVEDRFWYVISPGDGAQFMCEPNKWGIPNLDFQSHSIAHSGDALYVQRSPHNADMNVWRRRAFLLLLLFCACAMSVLNVGLACNRFLHRGYRTTEICCCFLAQLIYFHPILSLLTTQTLFGDWYFDILLYHRKHATKNIRQPQNKL